jgi:hypothetical protein
LVIGAKQNDWAQWLPLAAAVHNNKQNAILGLVPNQVLWGHDAQLLPEVDIDITNHTVQEKIEQMKLFHQLATEVINKKAQVTTSTMTPVFQEKEFIWLEVKNLRLPYVWNTEITP